MKELILQALNDAIVELGKRTPQTKVKTEFVNIDDVKPSDILNFMKKNNIPDNAYFGGKPNGYDAFDEICLCYDINIPTTEKDKLQFNKRVFSTIAHQFAFRLLTKNGYKRVGFNSGLLRQFDDTTVYDMYIDRDFDRLVKYYSLSFIKK